MPCRSCTRALSPPATRGHRPENQAPSAPFRRVNQDCVDIIVEYAVDSPEAILQLRRVSHALANAVSNLFALIERNGGGNDDDVDGWASDDGEGEEEHPVNIDIDTIAEPLLTYLRRDPECWDARAVFLAALYRARASPAGGVSALCFGELAFRATHRTSIDTFVRSFTRCFPHICKILLVRRSDVSDDGVTAIAENCGSLRSLTLAGCGNVTAAGITALAMQSKALSRIHIDSMSCLSPSLLTTIARHCKQLALLDIYNSTSESTRFPPGSWHAVARHLSALKYLDIEGSSTFADDDAIAIAEGCPMLTGIDMSGCALVTDVAIVALALRCAELSHIRATHTEVTEVGVCAVARNCRGLAILDVSDTRSITHRSLFALAQNCPRLRHLGMANTAALNPTEIEMARIAGFDSVLAVAQRCRELRGVDARTSCVQYLDAEEVAALVQCFSSSGCKLTH